MFPASFFFCATKKPNTTSVLGSFCIKLQVSLQPCNVFSKASYAILRVVVAGFTLNNVNDVVALCVGSCLNSLPVHNALALRHVQLVVLPSS